MAPWSLVDRYKWSDLEKVAVSIFSAEEIFPFALKLFAVSLSHCNAWHCSSPWSNTTCHENLRSYRLICSLQISLKYFLAQLRTWSGNFKSCAMLDYKVHLLRIWLFISVGPTSLSNITGELRCAENCTFVREFSVERWILQTLHMWILCKLLAVCT